MPLQHYPEMGYFWDTAISQHILHRNACRCRCEKVLGAYASGRRDAAAVAERFDVSYRLVARVHDAELVTGSRRRVL